MQPRPDFIFIGAARCASTWVHECLKEHPGVCMPARRKEVHFFNREENYARGIDWYLAHWNHCNNGQVWGEVTPTYLCHEPCAERIHHHCPQARLLVSLRNPIERAYSAYRGHLLAGRIDPGVTVKEASRKLVFDNQSSLIDHGFYHRHLTRFLRFFPLEKMLIVLYEDITGDPAGVLSRIYRFIGVDDSFVPPAISRKVNTGFQLSATGARLIRTLNQVSRSGASFAPRLHRFFEKSVRLLRNRIVPPESTAVPREVFEELMPIYREENEKLAALLKIDLSRWQTVSAETSSDTTETLPA